MANLELSKHGGADTTRGGNAEKKTEASFVLLDYATKDKEEQKSKQTKSFRLLESSKVHSYTFNMLCQQTCQCACSNAVMSDDMEDNKSPGVDGIPQKIAKGNC